MTSLFCLDSVGTKLASECPPSGASVLAQLAPRVFKLMLLSVHGALRSAGL